LDPRSIFVAYHEAGGLSRGLQGNVAGVVRAVR
jgi:hypothetical protein